MLDLQVIVDLMREVESADPIDWGMLNISEDEATLLIATSVMEHYETRIRSLREDERDYVIVSSMGKLALENFVLNLKLLRSQH